METMRLRAIQLPGNAGALLDSFIRAAGNLPRDSRELSRARELTPTLEKVAQREVHSKRGTNACHQHHRLQRMTTEFEEVVVHADFTISF